MSEIGNYINKLEALENNLVEKAKKAILDKQGLILGKAKLRLFNFGVDGDNSKITPEYRHSTVQIKAGQGQRTSHVTLRDTGEFYSSMFIDTSTNDIFINSTSEKLGPLISKYGVAITELTEQEQIFIIDTIIEPFLVKEINKLGLDIDLF